MYIPNVLSNIMPAFVIFCATTILLTISGIRSAGGLICIRYFCCSPSKFLHCLKNKNRVINYFQKLHFKFNNHYYFRFKIKLFKDSLKCFILDKNVSIITCINYILNYKFEYNIYFLVPI